MQLSKKNICCILCSKRKAGLSGRAIKGAFSEIIKYRDILVVFLFYIITHSLFLKMCAVIFEAYHLASGTPTHNKATPNPFVNFYRNDGNGERNKRGDENITNSYGVNVKRLLKRPKQC